MTGAAFREIGRLDTRQVLCEKARSPRAPGPGRRDRPRVARLNCTPDLAGRWPGWEVAYTRALPVAGAAELRTGELELVAPLETRPVSREGALPVRLVLLRAPVVLACLEAVVPLEPEGPLDAGADEDGGDAAGGFAGARGALTELDAETLGAEGGGGELTDAPAPAPAPPDLTDPLAPAEVHVRQRAARVRNPLSGVRQLPAPG